MRRLLRWLEERGEIDRAPRFPAVPRDRKPPAIHSVADQARVLAEIPWERRGIFLAMAHTLRPGEARALDLNHWREPDLLVRQAMKGGLADSPIGPLKERDWRDVGATDELVAWVQWRTHLAAPRERLRRVGVPLFPNPSTGARFTHNSLAKAWARAQKKAGVVPVPLYSGTKHTTATDLVRQGHPLAAVQRLLGHADRRSTDAYVQLADEDFKNLVRHRQRDR